MCADTLNILAFCVKLLCLRHIAKTYIQCNWCHVLEPIAVCKVLIRITGIWQCFAPTLSDL